jgi:archaellum component FlaC
MQNIVDDIIGIKSEIKEIERVMKNCKDIKRHCETVAAAAKKLRRLQG